MTGPIQLPRTTLEQRAPLYEDVETLISPGFLSHRVTLYGVSLCLRSLGPGDLFILRSRVGDGYESDWRRWAIASSIWMTEGYVLLGDPNFVPRMMTMVKGLPKTAQDILFSIVAGLFARQNRAIEATESYCYEQVSRFRWKTHGGHTPGSHSGIPWGDHLGTNSVQRIWTFHNEVEDQRIQDDALWEGFKLTTSAHAPKGIKKIDQRDRQTRQAELDRRTALQDRFYYTRLGLLKPVDPDEEGKSPRPQLASNSKSADELADEMYRWVSGQEDWHDQVVTDYKRRVSQAYDQGKRTREAHLAALRAQQELMGADTQTPMLVGYTAEQLSAMLRDRGVGRPGMTVVSEGGRGSREYLYRKYLEREPDVGALRPENGKLVVAEGVDLTAQLAQRQVPFRSGPEEE